MSPLARERWARVQRSPEAQQYARNSTVAVQHIPFILLGPELISVIQYEADSWLGDALEDLRALKQVGVNIPALGDFRIAEATMDHVRQLLTLEALQSLGRPQIIPFSGGGISLVWNVSNKELSFSVYPGDGEITYMMGPADQDAAEDGLVRFSERREISNLVSRFLSRNTR